MSHPALPGRTWVRQLGRGGFADVHLYREESPARDVAVKVLREAADADGRAAFGRELEALAAVAGHPAVVHLYDHGETPEGRPWLAMEACAPLENAGAGASVAEVLELVESVASGVEALHEAGFVHRDIKPANMMRTRWGRPVLVDLGAAVPLGTLPEGPAAGFSPAWSPPEQHVGAAADPSQDVWGLAATCWALLAGHAPFVLPGGDNGDAALLARTAAGAFGGLGRADCPPALEEVLRRALALSPQTRTPSAARFAHELREVRDALGTRGPGAVGGVRPADVPTDAPLGLAEHDPDATRPASVPLIDPRGLPTSDETRRGQAGNDPATVPARRSGSAPERPGPRPWVWALLAGILVVGTVAVTVGALLVQGLQVGAPAPSSPPPAQPLDPVAAPPAPVGDVVGELRGGRVLWTWRPSSQPGARYQVTSTRPGAEPAHQRTTFTTLEVEAAPGENCISVVVVGRDGRPSPPLERCLQVP